MRELNNVAVSVRGLQPSIPFKLRIAGGSLALVLRLFHAFRDILGLVHLRKAEICAAGGAAALSGTGLMSASGAFDRLGGPSGNGSIVRR